jgi:hypothetical protein
MGYSQQAEQNYSSGSDRLRRIVGQIALRSLHHVGDRVLIEKCRGGEDNNTSL